jgi:uncharacterized protein YecT (DUF1311 family)
MAHVHPTDVRTLPLLFAVLTVFSSLISGAVAGVACVDELYSAEFKQCVDRSGGAFAELMQCNSQELERQDRQLNTNYRKAIATQPSDMKKQLQEAQVLWLKYREANCKILAGSGDSLGQMGRLNSSSCFLSMTAQRTKELANFN